MKILKDIELGDVIGIVYIVILLVALIFMIFTIFSAETLAEGIVMNKRFSEGYCRCVNDECEIQKDRWIIEVQNGDKKDWWIVTEKYYDSVNIGDWVKK